MKLTQKLLLSLLLAREAVSHEHDHGFPGPAQPLTIKTKAGLVTGFINATAPDVRQWLGIPYAEPPVGSLRFLPPKPKKPFGHLTTQAYQPSCMQQLSNAATVYTTFMPEFLINGGQSEDCLYINIYAPLKPVDKGLPVFVYIPGGGFTGGGSDSLYKIPDQWIQRSQTHVVVIMNYRVNIFGFPNAAAQPLNAGLLDQRLVVEWVRDNIAAFGGSPKKITLWGQSAGASSVGSYGYAYPKDPIVTGLIADSGAAGVASGAGGPTAFSTFAGFVGCGNLAAKEQLACLQKVDAKQIQQTLSFGNTGTRFTPGADNVTSFANYTERIQKGLIANLPMITGSNTNEGAGFGTFSPDGMTPGQYQTGLNAITCPTAREASNRAKYGQVTYKYLYGGNFTNISPRPWIGATHSAELPLLFGTHYEFRGNSTEFEWDVAGLMQGLWLSFARNPKKDPSHGSFTWPKYDLDANTLVEFAVDDVKVQLASRKVVDTECGV
ncbi:Alpha/Beta hydrolase protein [Microdochium trichocladiopsis]|uniref:Carboxylic ester hydrolase n=1 Tax=Microdochium trichocladiopsis TaxID=1682393 RepID=A0A9P8YCM8_9PEZI|nr:Alpha/Beta hydrolase protein [Microdochium trichocladiopsis]KAH7035827.1 Alpha/Beta hydrolase protein [Microdochium trichocladiopsis]